MKHDSVMAGKGFGVASRVIGATNVRNLAILISGFEILLRRHSVLRMFKRVGFVGIEFKRHWLSKGKQNEVVTRTDEVLHVDTRYKYQNLS
jgi:hypothetical protein